MNQASLRRGLWLGSACALLALAPSAAGAQTYPPGTNCQSLLPNLRAACVDQARRLNSGTGNSNNTVIPNSAGSNTVPTPGTGVTGTTVSPNGTGVQPNGIISPNAVTPNGTVSPNAVTPNGTVSPNAVTPNGTVSPNAVGMPNAANPAPPANLTIVPPAGTGSGTSGN